jgi:phage terminase large subunit-like protein
MATMSGRSVDPTAHKPLAVFSVDHFRKYARRLVLDSGERWDPEDWQLDVVRDIFGPTQQVWLIVPQGNGKTTLMGGVALYHADFTPSPWVPLGAASAKQARILYTRAEEFIHRTPKLLERFKPQSGYLRILSRVNGGWGIQVYAADKDTGEGIIPTLCLVDEPHAQKDLGLYRTWRGKCRKRGATIVAISTAGEPGTDFEETRDKIRDESPKREELGPCRIRVAGPRIVMHEFKVPSPLSARDLDLVKAANPLVPREELAELLSDPTLDYGEDWLRKTCNIPARSSKAAISDADWAAARVMMQIPEGEPVWVGADFAWSQDTTAFVPLWWRDSEFRLLGPASILEPPGNGDMLDPQDVWDALQAIHERNPIEAIAADKTKAQDTLLRAEREFDCTVFDVNQGPLVQAEEYERFMEALRGGGSVDERKAPWLRHTGDPRLRRHVMNAIARKLPGDRYAFDRPAVSRQASKQDRRVIDALKAASMAHNVAVAESLKPSREVVFF